MPPHESSRFSPPDDQTPPAPPSVIGLRASSHPNMFSHGTPAIPYRPDIDGLRGLAVLCVLAFHAFPTYLPGGFVGVDMFFVISGFLISSQILGGLKAQTFSLLDFYVRRIRRIFPALLVVLGFCLTLGWYALLPDEYEQLGKQVAGAALFVSNVVLLFQTGYFDHAAETKPLLHLWSLGIEEQFYFVWPVLLMLCGKSRPKLAALFAVTGVLSFGLNVSLVSTEAAKVFYLPLFRFWELTLGGALAYWSVSGHASGAFPDAARWRNAGAVIGLIAISSAAIVVTDKLAFPGWWALLPTAGTALVIWSGPQAWINQKVLGHKYLVAVGLISYPLYLWHWPLLSFLRVTQSQWPGPALAAMAIAVSFVLATLTFLLIERPLRLNRHRQQTVAALLVGLLAIGLLGAVVAKQDGLPTRSSIAGLISPHSELTHLIRVDDACRRELALPEIHFDYCRYQKAATAETVAVIGDSHARVAFPGIAEVLAKRGVSTLLMANSSCPPLAGTPSTIDAEAPGQAFEKELASCSQKIEQIYAVLADKPGIKKVFFVTRGAIYLSGKGFGEPERKVARSPMVGPGAFEDGLRRTIEWLAQQGKATYFVLENPELGVDPAACLQRPLKISPQICHVDLKTVEARQAGYLSIFARLKGAAVIQTLPGFCPAQRCQIMRNGQFLYADDDHLSVAGSAFQAQEILRPWLEE